MIILVGLPGSGKSTLGRLLARKLALGIRDLDQEIEKRLGCSIRDFFAREGESNFRDIEEEELARALADPLIGVLATGGGVVLRDANRERLRGAGFVVYLRATPEAIASRLKSDSKRPLLQAGDLLGKLRELFEVRDPLYLSIADLTVDTGRETGPRTVLRIAMQLDQEALAGGWKPTALPDNSNPT